MWQKFDDNSTKWQGSSAQKWCEDFAGVSGDSVPDAFTSVERNAILETVKSDDTYNYVDSREPIVFDAYENILNGDKVFICLRRRRKALNTESRVRHNSLMAGSCVLTSMQHFVAFRPDRGSIIEGHIPERVRTRALLLTLERARSFSHQVQTAAKQMPPQTVI